MGRRYVVRVTIDRDGGVPLDDVADIARAISAALDEAESASGEFIAGEYQLEVSSPGVDRPLTLPRHWRRNIGRLVKVQGRRPHRGRPGGRGRPMTRSRWTSTASSARWPTTILGRGRVEVEFSRIDDVAEEDMVAFDDHDGDDDDRGDNDSDGYPDAEVDDES